MTRSTFFPLSGSLPRPLCLVALTLISIATFSSESRAEANNYDIAVKATAWVLTSSDEGSVSGTGVLIDAERKLVLTNAHVVGDVRNAVLFFRTLKNGKPIVEKQHYRDNVLKLGVRGKIIAVDRKRDLALIEINRIPEGIEAISMAEESPTPGVALDAIGNPGGSDALWSYTSGKVRSVYNKKFRSNGGGTHDFRVIETTNPINVGDSGGPMLNPEGKLVGIAQSFSQRSNVTSYCVDITEIKTFLKGSWKPAPLPAKKILEQTELAFEKHTATGHWQVDVDVNKKSSEDDYDQDEDDSSDDADSDKTKKTLQTVFVTKEIEYYKRADIRKIWTLAAKLEEAPSLDTVTRLLKQNAQSRIGAWSTERDSEGNHLVIYVAKLDATAAPGAMASTIEYVAKLAHQMKKGLDTDVKLAKDSKQTLQDWLAN